MALHERNHHPKLQSAQCEWSWLITPGIKNPKHVFIFVQQTGKQNNIQANPYKFDPFDIDGDDSVKLSTCRLQFRASFYPELDYEEEFKMPILNDLINFRYRRNDYSTGVQVQTGIFLTPYPISYFDLRSGEESLTGDSKSLTLHYQLNEAANAEDYTIYAMVSKEEELVVNQVGNELVEA